MNKTASQSTVNPVIEGIKNRRAIFPRSFDDREVSREDIELLMDCANHAPTHRMTQPWRFKVLRGGALKRLGQFLEKIYLSETPPDRISETKISKTRKKMEKSSAVILVCMQRDLRETVPEWEEIASVACAVQNLWIAAQSMGLGGYWSSPGAIRSMGEFVDLATGERCLGLFYLGHHSVPSLGAKRTPWRDKVEWIDE